MASGFFLGGMAEGFQAQQQNQLRQQALQLVQKAHQDQQNNFQQSQFMKLREQAVTHLQDTIDAVKNAHPDWTDLQVVSSGAVSPLVQQLSGFDKNLGLDPNSAQSMAAGFAAGKSQIQTQGELARAKEGPQHRALVQSEIAKNNAVAGVPGNPDLDTATQLGGPARGAGNTKQRGAGATFDQRFAQEGTQESPTVLTWGDARSKVAQKYGPEVATKAELWLKGNAGVVSGLRGSGAGKNNERKQIQDAAMDLARLTGMSADQINQNFIEFKGKTAAATAGGRTAASREANLGIILTAADSAIDAAITASDNVPRSDFKPLNTGAQWAQMQFSNPALQIFKQKNLQLAELWAKSFNPTGALRVDDRNLALDVLNTAIGRGTYRQAAQAIRDSIGLERAAANKFLKEKGFMSGSAQDEEDSGSEPGKGGVKVHGFTFTPTGQ